jgi:GT2 family glycosyltransferase
LTDQSKIVFLLANYYNEEEVCSFVTEQLQPTKNSFIEIVITDNGSKNTSLLTELTRQHTNVTLVTAPSNLGYFGAAYLGFTSYLNAKKEYPKAVVVSNTDMFLKGNFFELFQNKLKIKKFDILGPSIYSNFLKYYQNPYITRRIKKNKLSFLKTMSSNYYLYSLFTLYHVAKTKLLGRATIQPASASSPYAIHGSFMIFNKTFFEKGGTINYPSVLFGEEIFIAEQVLQLNLKISYDPGLQVEHNEHATTGIFKSRKMIAYLHQSYTYLLKTYFNK